MIVQRISGCCSASAIAKQPEPPPTSSSRVTPSKSPLRAMAIAAGSECDCIAAATRRARSISTWPLAQEPAEPGPLRRGRGAFLAGHAARAAALETVAQAGVLRLAGAEHVAPVEGAVAQQVEARRVRELVDALVQRQEAQRLEHAQHGDRRAVVEAEAVGQLDCGGRRLVQRLEDAQLVGDRHRRQVVDRKPGVPDQAVVGGRHFVGRSCFALSSYQSQAAIIADRLPSSQRTSGSAVCARCGCYPEPRRLEGAET